MALRRGVGIVLALIGLAVVISLAGLMLTLFAFALGWLGLAVAAAYKYRVAYAYTVPAMLGMVVLFAAGHAQSATLHDAAHDVRHATGFPCH